MVEKEKVYLTYDGYKNLLNEIEELKEKLKKVNAGRKEAFDAGAGDGWDSPEFEEIEREERRIGWLIDSKYEQLSRVEIIKDRDNSMISIDDIMNPKLIGHNDLPEKLQQEVYEKQLEIIKSQKEEKILVRGKESVVLELMFHRLAYLIISSSNTIKENNILTLTSESNIDKIKEELKKYIIDDTNIYTFNSFVRENLGEKVKIASRKTNNILNQYSFEECMLFINNFIKDYYDNYLVEEDIVIDNQVLFSKEEIKYEMFRTNPKVPNFDSAKQYCLIRFKSNYDSINYNLTEKYKKIYRALPMESPERKIAVNKSIEISKYLKENGQKIIKSYFKNAKKSNVKILEIFIKNIDKYIGLSSSAIEEYKNESLKMLSKRTLPKDLVFVILCINKLINGIEDKNIKHIFVNNFEGSIDNLISSLDLIFDGVGISTFTSLTNQDLSICSCNRVYDLNCIEKNKVLKLLN